MADTEYDPSAYGVDQVNEYLETANVTERQRVIQAERDGKARKGILEGPQASVPKAPADDVDAHDADPEQWAKDQDALREQADDAPEPPDKTPEGNQVAREAQQALEAEQGFLGDRGPVLEGQPQTFQVSDAAPEGVSTDPRDGFVVATGDKVAFDPPTTMAEHKAPKLEGDQRQGFTGELPNADNREDLTLQAALTRLPQNQVQED